jgi:hypothetical protein
MARCQGCFFADQRPFHPRMENIMAQSANIPSPRPDPNEKLVKVFDSEQESEAMIVNGLLESAGIESDLTAAAMVQDMFPGLGGMIILVREEDAVAAKKLIEDYREKSTDQDETAEIEIADLDTNEP